MRSLQTRHKDQMLDQCWPAVYDVGPTLIQHWIYAPCLLGSIPDTWETTIDWHILAIQYPFRFINIYLCCEVKQFVNVWWKFTFGSVIKWVHKHMDLHLTCTLRGRILSFACTKLLYMYVYLQIEYIYKQRCCGFSRIGQPEKKHIREITYHRHSVLKNDQFVARKNVASVINHFSCKLH